MLSVLPYDIIRTIGFHLNVSDLINFSNCSPVIHHVVIDDNFGHSYYNMLNNIKQCGYDSYNDFIKMVPGNNWLHSYKILTTRTEVSCEIRVSSLVGWRIEAQLHLYSTDSINTFNTRVRDVVIKYLTKRNHSIGNIDIYISNHSFGSSFSVYDSEKLSKYFLIEDASRAHVISTVYINMKNACPNITHSLIENIKVADCMPIHSNNFNGSKILLPSDYLINYIKYIYITAQDHTNP
jgi:hypothetical protein